MKCRVTEREVKKVLLKNLYYNASSSLEFGIVINNDSLRRETRRRDGRRNERSYRCGDANA